MSDTLRNSGLKGINTFNEGPLHAALKAWYAREGGQVEAPVDGFVIDVVQGPLLIEIQTQGFSSIKAKLLQLTDRHPVRLVYPIAREKWLLKLPHDDETAPKRRKSPKRGTLLALFDELVSFPQLLARETFSLEVLFIQEEEVRRHDPTRWRRGGWVTVERRLLDVVERRLFTAPADMRGLLPEVLPDEFTVRDLAQALGRSRRFAGKMAYCLRHMGLIQQIGKRGNAFLYRRM